MEQVGGFHDLRCESRMDSLTLFAHLCSNLVNYGLLRYCSCAKTNHLATNFMILCILAVNTHQQNENFLTEHGPHAPIILLILHI